MNRNAWAMVLAGIMILCLAISASAGGKQENPGNPKQVTISFWHHYNAQSPENRVLTQVVLPEFQRLNPGISVNAVSHDWDPLHTKILVSASSGQLPDVARSDIAWVPEFQKLNILVALDKEMNDFTKVSSQILDGPMNTARVKGNYYGIGLNTNTKILFYNKERFDKLGVTVPKTFDEFFSAAMKLSGKEGGKQLWGYGEPALEGWNICPFIWSNGGDVTDPQYTRASGHFNSPASIEIIQKLADLYKAGGMTGFNSGDIPLTDGYGQGRYAMIIEGPWKFAELAGSYPDFKPYTSQMPKGKGGSAQVLGGEDIVMFTTANKDAAWKFMKFMTGEFTQVEMSKSGQIPVNKAAVESNAVKAIATFEPFLVAIRSAKPRPPVSVWPQMNKILTAEVTLAMLGEKAVKTALDDAAQQMDDLLRNQ